MNHGYGYRYFRPNLPDRARRQKAQLAQRHETPRLPAQAKQQSPGSGRDPSVFTRCLLVLRRLLVRSYTLTITVHTLGSAPATVPGYKTASRGSQLTDHRSHTALQYSWASLVGHGALCEGLGVGREVDDRLRQEGDGVEPEVLLHVTGLEIKVKDAHDVVDEAVAKEAVRQRVQE